MMVLARYRAKLSQKALAERMKGRQGWLGAIEAGHVRDFQMSTVFRWFDACGQPYMFMPEVEPAEMADDAGEIAPTPGAAAS